MKYSVAHKHSAKGRAEFLQKKSNLLLVSARFSAIKFALTILFESFFICS